MSDELERKLISLAFVPGWEECSQCESTGSDYHFGHRVACGVCDGSGWVKQVEEKKDD